MHGLSKKGMSQHQGLELSPTEVCYRHSPGSGSSGSQEEGRALGMSRVGAELPSWRQFWACSGLMPLDSASVGGGFEDRTLGLGQPRPRKVPRSLFVGLALCVCDKRHLKNKPRPPH